MFIIFCREDSTTAPERHPFRERYPDGVIPGKFSQATLKTFSTAVEALDYAEGYADTRDVFVLDMSHDGFRRMYPCCDMEKMEENCARLELARNLGIDWNK